MDMCQKGVSCLTAVLIILSFAVSARAERPAIPVRVAVAESTLLTLKEPSKRVSIADPKIAEMNLISPKEVLINGRKIGITSLIVWNEKGKASFFDVIVTGDISQLQEQIKEVAPNDDIRADMAGDTIVLSGHARNQQTVENVVRLAQSYAVASEVKTTTSYSGGVAKETMRSSGKVINHIVIENAQQVLLEVKVAQLDKTKMKELGVSTLIKGTSGEGFTNLVGAPSGEVDTENYVGPGITTKAQGIAGNVPGLNSIAPLDPFQIGVSYFPSGIGAVLQALTSKGYATILAEPNLTVRSGEKGTFHVGTRYPIQVISGTGANATVGIQYEDVGIRLNFAPTVLETGAIRLKVDPAEVSSITNFVQLQNLTAPVVDTRTVTTSVDLRQGESLILAGLLSEDMKKNINKIPFFGDIPILGALFRSTTDQLEKRELVFIITPKLVKPMPPGTKTELPGQKPLTPNEEKEYQWIPLSMNKAGK